MEPRHSESRSLSHIRRGVGEKAKMLPPMRLPPFRGSDVMPETKLEIFQNQLLGNLFEPGQLHPGYALHLTIAQEFVVGFADNDNTALPANKSPVDNVRKGG